MTKFKIICPKCQAEFSANETHIGQTGVCDRCGAEFEIRRSAPPPLPANATEDPLVWNVGDVILDLYEVKQIHEGGGMGLVYRVHHRGWNVDLAVKSPRTDFFQTEQQKENFTRECETWINLGLHSHIVSCYYVRTLGGVPRVFAEYVEGGNLKDWIDSKELYDGDQQEALKRIFDIAIQMAWGLHYAHEQGLIHQDVKPANVLMTPDGTAKVSDFGLAKARAAAGDTIAAGAGRSILVSMGGMTPAYCSPEQANKQPLSRRTDIWSWGLSVLEMFAGEVFWRAGQAAAEALESYAEQGTTEKTIPLMPAILRGLLKRCFQQHPEKRPKNMGEVATELRRIYRDCCGTDYRRAEPKPVTLLADALNNRGVSMLDLGRKEAAEKMFEEALKIDSQHPESTYNLGLLRWRAAKVTDDVLVRQLDEIRKTCGLDWRANFGLGLVQLERGDVESALSALEEAAKANLQPDVQAAIGQAQDLAKSTARCVRTFEGHNRRAIRAVCLSADGCWALSGCEDETIRLWEVATGHCVRQFECGASSVTISANGLWALSGSWDDKVRLWEVATGRCMRTFEGHTEMVNAVSLSADGCRALSGGDRTVRLWEVATGRCVFVLEGHLSYVCSVNLSVDGCWALSGSYDNSLRLWEVATGQCVRTFDGHRGIVYAVVFSADVRWALSGSSDRTLRLWEVATGRCVRIFEGHDGSVESVSLSADGRWALSGSADKTVRLWEVSTGRCVRTFEGGTLTVRSVSLSADGRWALSGSSDCLLRLWDLTSLVTERLHQKSPARLSAVMSTAGASDSAYRFESLLAEGQAALKAGRYKDAHQALSQARSIPGYERNAQVLLVWKALFQGCVRNDLRSARCVRTFAGHIGSVNSVCLTVDGQLALSGGWDKTVRLWEVATGRCVRNFKGHTYGVNSVCLSVDGRWALTGSSDGTLRSWEVATGRCVRVFEGHSRDVWSVCFSLDGRWALSGSRDSTLRLWEVATGRCVRTFEGHKDGVGSACLSVDGRWVLSGSHDDTLRLWEVTTGRCVRMFKGGSSPVCLSSDGRWIVSGGSNKTLRLWDVATGQYVRTFEGHTDPVTAVNLSADGRWVLSGSGSSLLCGLENTLRLWEVSTGRCVRVLEGHTNAVNSVKLSSDGCWALSGSSDATLRLWELDWDYESNPEHNTQKRDADAQFTASKTESLVDSQAIEEPMVNGQVPVADGKLASNVGIETRGGVFTALFKSGTPIPCERREIFSTAVNNQTTIEVHILYGTSTLVSTNMSLGRFKLTGFPKAPQGVPQIEVTFRVQQNSEFVLVARCLKEGTSLHVVRV